MKNFDSKFLLAACLTIFCLQSTIAIDDTHFYRATNFLPIYHEPHFAEKGLTSFDIFVSHGSTRKARAHQDDLKKDKCTKKDCCDLLLLNICGLHNMHKLGEGVPDKDPTNPADLALINLEALPGRDCFGKLLFGGEFNITEAYLFFTQNLARGLFIQAHLPIRHLEINCITFTDQSPTDSECPNINTPEWQTFLNIFDDILTRYNLDITDFKETAIGDTTLFLGYAYHYEDTEILDFFDVTLRVGVLIGTGKQKDQNKAFSIDHGYGGHMGIPFNAAAALGAYEWLTVGAHVHGTVFAKKTKEIRMKTSTAQNGFITLAKDTATIDKGSLWGAHMYLKADHVLHGFSATVGYSFSYKRDDFVCPCDLDIFDKCIVNSDCLFKEWKNHTFHLFIEYDFSTNRHHIGPRIGGFFNWQVGGTRVFKTHTGGSNFGIDMSWFFD
ncbi:hypothetical protein KC460_00165 [Candidatus Dependentiae bacterium]|nr:hypothetical protein [Candidatus Dependentiae bacterium]